MLDYQRRFPINPGQIQFWTAEMWSLLWNLWLSDYKTEITNELDFSWATDNVEKYEKRIQQYQDEIDRLWQYCFNRNYKNYWVTQDAKDKYVF
jgi:hypothetical protein